MRLFGAQTEVQCGSSVEKDYQAAILTCFLFPISFVPTELPPNSALYTALAVRGNHRMDPLASTDNASLSPCDLNDWSILLQISL